MFNPCALTSSVKKRQFGTQAESHNLCALYQQYLRRFLLATMTIVYISQFKLNRFQRFLLQILYVARTTSHVDILEVNRNLLWYTTLQNGGPQPIGRNR